MALQNISLNNKIAEGSYSIVYKIYENNIPYAIKILKEDVADVQNYYENEIKVLAHFKNHDYVVKLIQGEIRPEYFMIKMEFVEGESLFNLICESQYQPFMTRGLIKKIFVRMTKGLDYIHSQGIIHGDIKLENVIVSVQKEIKVKWIDFGFSKIIKDNPMINTFEGSPRYLAPEQYACAYSNENYYNGFAVDVWALIVCLYGMITKDFPFDYDDVLLYIKISKSHPPFDYKKNQSTINSKNLQNLFREVFVLDPSKRIGLKEVLNHDWLIQDEFTQSAPIIINHHKDKNYRRYSI